jgi:hypothetical protein
MRRIRRNARKKGISETEAYFQWLNRKQARRPTGSNFAYSADTRPPKLITTPTPEEAARDTADEPLKALAASRSLSLQRQLNGKYYFLNFDKKKPDAMVRNPANPSSYDFL